MDISDEQLIEEAREARERAFAPYSEFRVGAVVATDEGLYWGANVEVSGRSTSTHAEMLAMFKAVTDGATEFNVMAIAPDSEDGVGPCGLCQHTIAQFTDELRIIEAVDDETTVYMLSDLIGPAYSPATRHVDTQVDT